MHGTVDPLGREIDRITVRLLTLERFEKRGLLRFGQKRELQKLRQWAIDTNIGHDRSKVITVVF